MSGDRWGKQPAVWQGEPGAGSGRGRTGRRTGGLGLSAGDFGWLFYGDHGEDKLRSPCSFTLCQAPRSPGACITLSTHPVRKMALCRVGGEVPQGGERFPSGSPR